MINDDINDLKSLMVIMFNYNGKLASFLKLKILIKRVFQKKRKIALKQF